MNTPTCSPQEAAEERVEHFRKALGPFVTAAEETRMPMIFTDEKIERHPVVFANDSFLALAGFKRSDILGKGIASLLRKVTNSSALSTIELSLDKGVEGTLEAHCRRSDGSEYLATVFFTPVRDAAGIIRQYFLSFVEVSGRTERLLKQRDQLGALYEAAPGFIAALEGPEHRFTYANASYKRLVGHRELVGERVIDAFPELEKDQGLIQILDRAYATGEPYVAESMPITLANEDGRSSRVHYLNFVYQPVRDDAGTVVGLFVEGQDVTNEWLAAQRVSLLQSELVHASRVNAMGMMAATLAHELNQPLAAMSTYAGAGVRLVDPSSQDASLLTEALRSIEEAAQRAGAIIQHLRELTRRGETAKTMFNLGAATSECVRLVSAGGCTGGIIHDHTPGDLNIYGDRTQIQQVLINLLHNACEASQAGEGARVTIDAALKGSEIVVSVTDTGVGLSADAAQNMFAWTDSTKEGGTGLGLAICRTIIEGHHGRIWLQRSDECGSQFCFSIPTGSC